MSFMDKAKGLVDKIPDSVKDKIPDSVKDKLGIDEDATTDDATTQGTDPGAVSDVAAATSSDDANTAMSSSAPAYTKDPDGTDPPYTDTSSDGAGRAPTSDITKSP